MRNFFIIGMMLICINMFAQENEINNVYKKLDSFYKAKNKEELSKLFIIKTADDKKVVDAEVDFLMFKPDLEELKSKIEKAYPEALKDQMLGFVLNYLSASPKYEEKAVNSEITFTIDSAKAVYKFQNGQMMDYFIKENNCWYLDVYEGKGNMQGEKILKNIEVVKKMYQTANELLEKNLSKDDFFNAMNEAMKG